MSTHSPRAVRAPEAGGTELLVEPLGPEDLVVQAMPDASPAKWHLAHTTWFFETFLLQAHVDGYQLFDASFGYLFNSYYETLGPRQPRPQRGLLTRPDTATILAYRRHVNEHMQMLIQSLPQAPRSAELEQLVQLGLAHEEQHQELLLMDVLALFSLSPLRPVYDSRWPRPAAGRRGRFVAVQGGRVELGRAAAAGGFAFDNESPRHSVWLADYAIGDRLVTNGEWLEFMA